MLRLMPLILLLGAALPLQAAETSTPPAATGSTTATADPAAQPERRSQAECGQTGTRIKGGNRTQSMRCYSRGDLARTGATDLRDALRRLDPTIR
jgi:hypothetical protein